MTRLSVPALRGLLSSPKNRDNILAVYEQTTTLLVEIEQLRRLEAVAKKVPGIVFWHDSRDDQLEVAKQRHAICVELNNALPDEE
jgi:hypothetical protein